MAGRLSFSIALNLLTENFKKGASTVQNGLRSMQMQVLTFAAALGFSGVGLTGFISKLIETARETGRVTTALKNVSGSMAQYAANQKFVLSLAKKYGVEVLALTGNYAKFTAAASNAGVAMSDQKKIFESVSRASVAFGLTADDTNLTFLAITQMMSKGKISSEELRRQLGERLPIAMAAMAKAAGVPINKLDKLLQQGKLMSNEVLPKFADALNKMIPDVNTDNLETSLNRMKNAFTAMVKDTATQQAYKGLIDNITKLIETAASNVKTLLIQLVSVLTGVIFGRFFKWFVSEIAIAERIAMLSAAKTAKAAGATFDVVAWKASHASSTMQTMFTRSITAIKTAFFSMLPAAIVMGIGYVISKMIAARDEAKRIRSIFDDYQKESYSIGKPEEADRLNRLYAIVKDTNNSYNVRKNALININGILQSSYSINKNALEINGDINSKISERVKLLKDAAAVEFYQKKKLEAEGILNEISGRYGGLGNLAFAANNPDKGKSSLIDGISALFGGKKMSTAYIDASIVSQQQKVITDTNKQLDILEKSILAASPTATNINDDGDKKKTDLQKAEEEYAESIKELTNQKKNEAITGKEYQEALDKLNEASFKKLSGLLSPEQAAKNKSYQQAKSGYNSSISAKIEKEYFDSLNELSGQYKIGAINEQDYKDSKIQLIEKTLKEMASVESLTEANFDFIEDLKLAGRELKKVKAPTLEKRESFYDYKKSKADIAAEELDVAKNNLDKLKEAYKDIAKEMEKELNSSMSNVKTLEDALKIARVRQDVKDLGKEMNETLYGGVKDIASSADRVVSAFSNLKSVFSDVDASGWEKIMAVWNALTSTVDSFLSILELIKTMTELINRLAIAKQAESDIDSAVAAKKVSNTAVEIAADQAGVAISKTTTASKVADATTEVSANTAVAATAAGKSVAGIPFVGIALAAAAIGGIMALFSSIPKFAGGGIVQGGASSGDKILARVNSGEMILNKMQQSSLFNLLDRGINVKNSSGDVHFVIEGEKLVGVLNRYNKRQGRIR
nr:tape measure protein [uncultured Macellibacteroides sp.]